MSRLLNHLIKQAPNHLQDVVSYQVETGSTKVVCVHVCVKPFRLPPKWLTVYTVFNHSAPLQYRKYIHKAIKICQLEGSRTYEMCANTKNTPSLLIKFCQTLSAKNNKYKENWTQNSCGMEFSNAIDICTHRLILFALHY